MKATRINNNRTGWLMNGLQPLTEKYEPTCFDEFVGNEQVVRVHQTMARNHPKIPILMTGPTGTGKSTLSRLFARSYLCGGDRPEGVDLCGSCDACQRLLRNETDMFGRGLFDEESAADGKGFDHVLNWLNYGHGPLILDECDRMLIEQHRLLPLIKQFRHPIIFTTVYAVKLDPQLKGRCMQFTLKPVPNQALRAYLHKIARSEGKEISDKEITRLLTEMAQAGEKGLVRNAMNRLETLLVLR